jgi:PIN domain nuclease of toxin-antitoxin system
VNLLIDTHVFLWWRIDSRKLKRPARDSIATADIVWVSAATAWEVAIKRALGRLTVDGSLLAMIDASEFTPLHITFEHAARVGMLPPHHGDPFDRMLIAQALVEGATMVSHDRQLEPYDVPIIWT